MSRARRFPPAIRRRANASPSRPATPRSRAALDAALCVTAVVLALAVHRRAWNDAFAPDDLLLLEKAVGLRTWGEGVWRLLSVRGFWEAGAALFGGHAPSWHAVVLLLHGAVVVASYVLTRTLGAGPWIAFAAAAWFGTHRALFDALLPVSTVGDVMAALLLLAALLILTRVPSVPGTVLASVTFAAALLAKESVAVAPLAALVLPVRRGARITLLAFAAAGAGFLLWLARSGQTPEGLAYEVALGPNVATQLLAYAAAATDVVNPVPDLWPANLVVRGSLVLAVLVGAAVLAWRRSRLPAFGVLAFVLALAPVLVLRESRHLHYLYVSLAFLGLALAATAGVGIEKLAARVRPAGPAAPAWLPVTLLALLAAHVLHSERAIAQRADAWIAQMALPYDPLLRKMTVARNALATLGPALEADSAARLVILEPPGRVAISVRTGAPTTRTPTYELFSAVLDSGRAISAVHPRIAAARIITRWSPEFAGWWIATYSGDGRIHIMGRGPQAHAALVERWQRSGFGEAAREHLDAVLAGGETDSTLRRLALSLP